MNLFFDILNAAFQLLNIKMNLFGFMISYWDVMIYSAIAILLMVFIGRLIYGK